MDGTMRRPRFGALQIGIVLLALATAGIHFFLALNSGDTMTTVMFTLNAIGYVGLVAALYLRLPILYKYPRLVRFALIGFTLLTIILWAVMGSRTTVGYVTKAIEVLLAVLLFIEKP